MRVKVAHVITRLDLGGAQQNTLHTSSRLDASRFEVLLVCGEGGYFDQEVRADEGLRTVFLDSLVREVSPLRDILALLELRALFAAERPEIVHTHSSKAGILGRLAAAMAGVPIIIHTYHGFGFHDRQNHVSRTIYILLERLCALLTTRLVFVSRANAAYAARCGIRGAEQAALIRSGVRLSDLPAQVDADALKASVGIVAGSPLVVSIGNLKPQKNIGDLVAAAALTVREVPEARFVVLGDGPQRRELAGRILEFGLEGKFLLLGWRQDGPQWLAAADVFALTSLWEGLPRALVEALKSGRPSVCYAVDGITDILRDGEGGFLVDSGDVAAFAERLARLLRDKSLRERLGAGAARAIGPEFDIDGMVRSQEALYDSLLAARRG